jgi:phage terminase large subunit-like protein
MAGLKGVQEPSFSVVPRHLYSDGPDTCDLASGYGFEPDPWQREVLDGWLGTTKVGKYTASDCGLSVPRQNGKNAALEFLELYKSAIQGRKILHTAHEVKTCRKHFLRMKAYFENPRKYPELAELVQSIRLTNGQEAIELKNGGQIEFIARSKSSGRGFTVDDLVCDEAQELTDEQMEAIQPAISAAPSGDPQTIYTGTPTPPTSAGTVFARIRKEARSGSAKRLCWYEWSVNEIGDVNDRERWARTNPALGYRLLPTVIYSELKKFTPDGFARERLGWWNDQASALSDLDLNKWRACATKKPAMDGYSSYAVKFAPDGSNVSLSACVRPPKDSGEKPHIEVIGYRSAREGVGWLADFLEQRASNAIGIVIDGRVGAPTLVQELADRKIPANVVITPRAGDLINATSMFEQALQDGRITHFNQPLLNDAAEHAKHRKIGNDGGFGYEPSMENKDVYPLECVALAYWNATTSKRHPGRKQKVMIS